MNLNSLKKLKYKVGVFFLIISLFTHIDLSEIALAAADTSSSKTDIVLVLDASKSMEKSDPKNISTEAMKMFIDMCHVQGDKIGMAAYSDTIVKESNLKEMNTAEDKKQLKDMLNNIKLGQWTDIGLGLKRAIEILDNNHDAAHKPVVVLLSDGKNDPSRSKEQSENDLNSALKTAKDKGYPIYTIGLNADGTVDKNQLETISKETNGKNFITNTANDLPQILREIFADNSQLKIIKAGTVEGNGDYQEVKINIPDANVVEANISLLSSNAVEVKLIDPKGQEQAIPSQNVIFSSSKQYSMLKILSPSQGDWLLKVKGLKGDQIDISLLFNYDLQVTMNLTPNSNLKKGDKIKINAIMTSNNQAVQDAELYKNMKAKLIATDTQNNSVKEIELINKGNNFEGEYVVADNGKYELKVKVEGQSFYRESNTVSIDTNSINPTQPIAKTKSISPSYIIFGVIFTVIVLLILIFVYRFLKIKNKKFVGEMMLQIEEGDTGKISPPKYRKLSNYKGSVTLHHLTELDPELNETSNIIFKPVEGDKILLINKSSCIVQQFGINKDASKGFVMKNNTKITIKLTQKQKNVTIEFLY